MLPGLSIYFGSQILSVIKGPAFMFLCFAKYTLESIVVTCIYSRTGVLHAHALFLTLRQLTLSNLLLTSGFQLPWLPHAPTSSPPTPIPYCHTSSSSNKQCKARSRLNGKQSVGGYPWESTETLKPLYVVLLHSLLNHISLSVVVLTVTFYSASKCVPIIVPHCVLVANHVVFGMPCGT